MEALERTTSIKIPCSRAELRALKVLAFDRGIPMTDLVRGLINRELVAAEEETRLKSSPDAN